MVTVGLFVSVERAFASSELSSAQTQILPKPLSAGKQTKMLRYGPAYLEHRPGPQKQRG